VAECIKLARGHTRPVHLCRAVHLLGAIIVLTASACMVGPNYKPPMVKLPSQWNGDDEITRVNGRAEPQIELSQWWRSFNDPVLNNLIDEALASNYDNKIAIARIREERDYLVMSRAGLFPEIDAAGSYTRQRYSANTPFGAFPQLFPIEENLYQTGFDSEWELDIFGGIRRGVQAAQAELDASVENERDVQVSLLAEVARDYIAVRALQRRLRIATANLRDQHDSLALTRARFQMGFAPRLNVIQARSLLETTESEVPELQTGLAQTIHQIDVLLGRTPDALAAQLSDVQPIPGASDPDAIAVRIPAGLPSGLLLRRPDIRGAERELAAAAARIGVATADLYPKFSITGFAGLESISTSNLFFATSRTWNVGPSMTWPIFEAGRIRANIAAKNAQEEQALFTYRKTILGALAEVEDALVAYANERDRRQALAASAADFQRTEKLARERYEEGHASYLDVLEAQRSLYNAQDALAQSDQQAIDDLIALYKALGGGWDISRHYGGASSEKEQAQDSLNS
jgi:outer membrane protein, multidrug efflux system